MSLLTNLGAAYEFESGNLLVDGSGNALTLSNLNTATSVAGKVGNAVQCVGATPSYLYRASNSLIQPGPDYSWAFWINFTSVGGTADLVINKDSGSNDGNRQFGVITLFGKLQVYVFNTANAFDFAEWGTTVTTGTWYFVVCGYRFSDKTIRISVNDGTPVVGAQAGGAISVNTSGTADLLVGGRGDNSFPFSGLLDQFLIYQRDLFSVPADITALYNSGNGLTVAQMNPSLTVTGGAGAANFSGSAPRNDRGVIVPTEV